MAREVQQQLSLADDPGLQGDLFGGEPEPEPPPAQDGDGPDDQALLADASARPRRRRPAASTGTTEPAAPAQPSLQMRMGAARRSQRTA